MMVIYQFANYQIGKKEDFRVVLWARPCCGTHHFRSCRSCSLRLRGQSHVYTCTFGLEIGLAGYNKGMFSGKKKVFTMPGGYVSSTILWLLLFLVSKWNTYSLLCMHFSIFVPQLCVRREMGAGNWSSLWIFSHEELWRFWILSCMQLFTLY